MLATDLFVVSLNLVISVSQPPSPPTSDGAGEAGAERVQQMFDRWDRNHDGVIDRDEFANGMRHLHQRMRHGGDGPRGPRGPNGEFQGRPDESPPPDAPPPPPGPGLENRGPLGGPQAPGARGQDPRQGRGQPRAEGGRGSGRERGQVGDRFMRRFDKDKDGVVTADEFPGDPKRFEQFDTNHDGRIDRSEVAQWRKAHGTEYRGKGQPPGRDEPAAPRVPEQRG